MNIARDHVCTAPSLAYRTRLSAAERVWVSVDALAAFSDRQGLSDRVGAKSCTAWAWLRSPTFRMAAIPRVSVCSDRVGPSTLTFDLGGSW